MSCISQIIQLLESHLVTFQLVRLVSAAKLCLVQPCLYFGPTQNKVRIYWLQEPFHNHSLPHENETISHSRRVRSPSQTRLTPQQYVQYPVLLPDTHACTLRMFSGSYDSDPRRPGPLCIDEEGPPNSAACPRTQCSRLRRKTEEVKMYSLPPTMLQIIIVFLP